MDRLDYTVLLEAYERALSLNLEEDFIELLKEEINMRKHTCEASQEKKKLTV